VVFYRDVLGLPEVSSPSTFPGAGLNVRWFLAGTRYLHLYIAPEPDTRSPRHFALEVADIAEARKLLTEKGVPIRETVKIPGAERFFIADPDGNRIELIQWQDRGAIKPI
ncbi:MAG: VOC family protein, partial [Limisphaerales bacterium]